MRSKLSTSVRLLVAGLGLSAGSIALAGTAGALPGPNAPVLSLIHI